MSGIEHLIKRILREEIVIAPTSTLPALSALPTKEGLDRVFEVKKRDLSKPISLAVTDLEMAAEWAVVSDLTVQLARAFESGSLTFILPALTPLDQRLGGKEIALRPIVHPVMRLLVKACGPLTVTSANISGEEVMDNCKEIAKMLGLPDDAALDIKTEGGLPSTVVNMCQTGDKGSPIIMREGTVGRGRIAQWLQTRR